MKTNFSFSKTMLLMCFAVSICLSSCKSDDEPTLKEVVFADPLLKTQVQLALGLSETDMVTEENIKALTELDINGNGDLVGTKSGISSLSGLEYAINLTYLHFGETAVTDLTPIKDLTKITYLRMNNTGVTNLSPISGYTTLTYFNANTTTGITDISPLSGNTGLQEIILRSVPFGNAGMSTFLNFKSLYRLNMRSTGVTNITVLGQLMSQGALLDTTPGAAENGGATLDLRGLEIEDFSPIDPYVNQISNLDGYSGS